MRGQAVKQSDFTSNGPATRSAQAEGATPTVASVPAAFASQYHEFQVNGASPSPSRRMRKAYGDAERKETAETRQLGVCTLHKQKKTRCTPYCEHRQLRETAPSHISNDDRTPKSILRVRALAPKPQEPPNIVHQCVTITTGPGKQSDTAVANDMLPSIRRYVTFQEPHEVFALRGVVGNDLPLTTLPTREMPAVCRAVDILDLPEPADLHQVPERQDIIVNKERAKPREVCSVGNVRKADATRLERSKSPPKKRQREKCRRFDSGADLRTQLKAEDMRSKSNLISNHDSRDSSSRAFTRRAEEENTNRGVPLNRPSSKLPSSLRQSDHESQSSRSFLPLASTKKPMVHDPRAALTISEPRWEVRDPAYATPTAAVFRHGPSMSGALKYIDPAQLEYKSPEISDREQVVQFQHGQRGATQSPDVGDRSQRPQCASHTWKDDDDTEIVDEAELLASMPLAALSVDPLHEKIIGAEDISKLVQAPMGNLDTPWYSPE